MWAPLTQPDATAPQLGVAYQPTFGHDAAWDLVVFAIYMGLWTVGKFALTFLRSEVTWLGGLPEAQLLAVGLLLSTTRTRHT
jgi:hypothetical protein